MLFGDPGTLNAVARNIRVGAHRRRRFGIKIFQYYATHVEVHRLRKLVHVGRSPTKGRRGREGNRGGERREGAEAMQMESYTAEKRILNQQLGRRRANRVDACFSSLDQRRRQDSCRDMHADMFAVLHPPLPPPAASFSPYSLRPRSAKQHQVDFVSSCSISEGRPRTTRAGHKYLLAGICRI